jgi:hypothetical protein
MKMLLVAVIAAIHRHTNDQGEPVVTRVDSPDSSLLQGYDQA